MFALRKERLFIMKDKYNNRNSYTGGDTIRIDTDQINRKASKTAPRKTQKKPTPQAKKTNKTNKKGKKKSMFKKLLLIFLVLFIIGAGILAGVIFGLFGKKYSLTKENLMIDISNSKVVDSKGKKIATLSAKENREILTKAEMGDYLPKAFVSIEDERFYKHHGVDIKRTGAAVAMFLFHKGESSFGGSTITQQLVKNITNEKEDSGTAGAVRKIKEMVRAHQVENILSKDQILEMYMNIIFLGGKVHGVGMASKYYFDKDAKDLSLAESAYIAGITHSPNAYKPFAEKPNTDTIKKRTKTVLSKMHDLGNITDEEYSKAEKEVDKGLKFKEGKINQATYSSHTQAMVNQIIDQLVSEKGMDKEYAKTYVYGGGFTIHSTQDSSIQKILQNENKKSMYQVRSLKTKDKETGKYETAQSATVVIDHTSGNVVGCVGNLGSNTAFDLNRATQSKRQPGSSIKPIGVYGPALQEGVITASSVYDDVPISYGKWSPKNAYSGFKGLSNMRQAIRISQNTIAVQVLDDLSPAKSLQYLKKMGVTSLNDNLDNNLSLALGGISEGISPLQMAGAYATIANDGEYIPPTFYSKMEDSNGKTILTPTQEKTKVFSKQVAYILKELLTEPTKGGGTATNCKISGMETAAKTGTTNSKKDKWLCGFTPYYTAATWYGYDTPEEVRTTTYASVIWKNVMAKIHSGKKSASFERPSGIIQVAVCKDSGMLASDACRKDIRGGRVYTEYFVKGTEPKKSCTCHVTAEICKKTHKLATDKCLEKETKAFITRSSDSKAWQKAADAKYTLPSGKCTKCDGDQDAPKIKLNGPSTITLKLNETYTEQGATAEDKVDGNLTDKIEVKGTVNTSKAGTYTITYTVKDANDNVAKVTRKVIVAGADGGKSATPKEDNGKDSKEDKTNTTTNTTANSKT